MLNLLIIDDSTPFLHDVELLLKNKYVVFKAENGKKGMNLLRKENISVVLLDLQLPDIYGLEVLKSIHEEIDPLLPVIISTDHGNIDIAVDAMKLGASDFIQKDFSSELLNQKILKALDNRDIKIELKTLKDTIESRHDYFVCASNAMLNVDKKISLFSKENVDVLLTGESGVGKDIIAYEIHKRGPGKNKLFVEVPLNSINDSLLESELFGYEKGAFTGADNSKIGKFEAANGGTIYLPEISEISERIQLKLLSFMQYKEISKVGPGNAKKIKLNVRIIMATNKDLKELVNNGKIREDFYYRINVMNINVPSLRERKDGIDAIANYFLEYFQLKHNKKGIVIGNDLLNLIKNYEWKGNLRELKNAFRNAVILSENNCELKKELFPDLLNSHPIENENDLTFHSHVNKSKAEYLNALLKKVNGNKTRAAEIAGLSRQGLLKILKELNLE